MKKVLLFLGAVISSVTPAFARDGKKSNKRLNFELMEPVNLKNPQKANWGLVAGGPKYTVYKKAVVKPVEEIVVAPVVKEEVVIEPAPTDAPVSSTVTAPASEPTIVLKEEVKEDVKVEEKTSVKEEEKVVPVEEKKEVVSVKEEVKENPVVNIPAETLELKEEAPVSIDEKEEASRTDKNIDEAKKLLQVAERLANSVIEENEVKPLATEEKKEVAPVKEEVKKVPVVTDSEKPRFVMKFSATAENLKKADEKKIADLVPALKSNEDVTVKIISYYSSNSGRNIAFSRLLNARSVLLEKDVPTSQIMIMVLEDEEANTPKADTVEVFVVR